MNPQSLTRRLLVALCALASATALAAGIPVPNYEEEDLKPDTEFPLPPAPKKENLVPYPMMGTNNQVFIDDTSLKFGENYAVAYTLVVRSPSGAENVTFEVLRCAGDRHVLAYGRRDGTWSPARTSAWLPVQKGGSNSYYYEFWRDIFCRDNVPLSMPEIRANIKRGDAQRDYESPD